MTNTTSTTPADLGRDTPLQLSLPDSMRATLADRAKRNHRTTTAEAVALIERGMLVANPLDIPAAVTTLPARRRADQLVERARIAFLKAGGREQPSEDSDVVEIDGTTTVTLRNINGALAVYQLHGDALRRVPVISATVDQLIEAAFAGPRSPRSAEYKAGARAALAFRVEGTPIQHTYPADSAQDDAFCAGMAEGHAIWRRAQAHAAGAA